MAKIIKTGDEARNLLKNGIKTINDAVKITLSKGKKCSFRSKIYISTYNQWWCNYCKRNWSF